MPKSQFIDPNEVRKSGWIKFFDIPVNQYNKTLEEERQNFSDDQLIRIYRDMLIIREFETMLSLIKTTGEYNGIKYDYPGPAHLSIGQEAVAVGQAFVLDKDDFIFGSHRSHGEVIAKGLSTIEKLSDNELLKIMESYFDGSILRVVEENLKNISSIKELAVNFSCMARLPRYLEERLGFKKVLAGLCMCSSHHLEFTRTMQLLEGLLTLQ